MQKRIKYSEDLKIGLETFNPGLWRYRKVDLFKFEVNLVYTASFKPARGHKVGPCLSSLSPFLLCPIPHTDTHTHRDTRMHAWWDGSWVKRYLPSSLMTWVQSLGPTYWKRTNLLKVEFFHMHVVAWASPLPSASPNLKKKKKKNICYSLDTECPKRSIY